MENHKVIYRDQEGMLEGSMSYDGEDLILQLAGLNFSSRFMDGFIPDNHEEVTNRFELDAHNDLTNFSLLFNLPLRFLCDKKIEFLNLICELEVQKDDDNYSRPYLRCKFQLNDLEIDIPTAGTIEGAINQLNKQLPSTIKYIGCYNCKFSDYSVYGQQFWGSMLCFKNIKHAYSRVKNKDEYMDLMDNFNKLVPESHYCNEFEERPKIHTGYRG